MEELYLIKRKEKQRKHYLYTCITIISFDLSCTTETKSSYIIYMKFFLFFFHFYFFVRIRTSRGERKDRVIKL